MKPLIYVAPPTRERSPVTRRLVLAEADHRMATHWRVWYGTNPQRDRLAQLRHSASKRQARITCILASAKRTIGCTDCGFSDQRALQWDHVDPTIKLGNVGGMGNWSATWREMAKCVVRCANCHAIRTYEEGHTRRALT